MAYAVLVDRIERRALADRQGAWMAVVMGAKNVELPDPAEHVARFDEWLASPLAPQRSTEQQALRRVLLGHD